MTTALALECLDSDNVWSLMQDVYPTDSLKIRVTFTLLCAFKNFHILKLSLLLGLQAAIISKATWRFYNLLANNSIVLSHLCYRYFSVGLEISFVITPVFFHLGSFWPCRLSQEVRFSPRHSERVLWTQTPILQFEKGMADWNVGCWVCKAEQPGSVHPGENRWQNCHWYVRFLGTWLMKWGEPGAPLSSVSSPSAPHWLSTNNTTAYLSVPVTYERKMLHRVSLVFQVLCTY